MIDEDQQPRSTAGLGVLEHLLIASRVAECRNRTLTDEEVVADWLAAVSSMKKTLGS